MSESSKPVNTLILMHKEDFEDVIKQMSLRWEDHPVFPGWTEFSHKGYYHMKREGHTKAYDDGNKNQKVRDL